MKAGGFFLTPRAIRPARAGMAGGIFRLEEDMMSRKSPQERASGIPAEIARLSDDHRRTGALANEYEALAGLSDEQALRRAMRSMVDSEFQLNDDDLRRFIDARLAAWARLEDEPAKVVTRAYRAALEDTPAEVALRNAEFTQSALLRLAPPVQQRLRTIAPVLFDEQAAPQLGEGPSARYFHEAGAGIGTPVYSADGKRLGTIDGAEGKYIRVAAAHAPDYWLTGSLIQEASHERVVIGLDGEAVDDYKLDEPDVAESTSPALDQRPDALSGDRNERAKRQSLVHTRGRETETRQAEGPLDEPGDESIRHESRYPRYGPS